MLKTLYHALRSPSLAQSRHLIQGAWEEWEECVRSNGKASGKERLVRQKSCRSESLLMRYFSACPSSTFLSSPPELSFTSVPRLQCFIVVCVCVFVSTENCLRPTCDYWQRPSLFLTKVNAPIIGITHFELLFCLQTSHSFLIASYDLPSATFSGPQRLGFHSSLVLLAELFHIFTESTVHSLIPAQ